MTRKHTCPTCGYDEAVWMLRISTSNLTLCENCLPEFSNKYSHVYSLRLRKESIRETHITIKRQAQSVQDKLPACGTGTHRRRKSIALRTQKGDWQ